MASRPHVEGRVYHLGLKPGDIPGIVLLPGDPERIGLIGSLWDRFEVVARHREFVAARGVYRGIEVGAVSTGIGGGSASIAVEELASIGAHTFIRVGTAGSISPMLSAGSLVIGVAAVRFDGASSEYAPSEYPAHASPDLVLALVEAAERLGVDYAVGVVASTATFYPGQSRPGLGGYQWSLSESRMRDLQRMGVLAFEMEAATIYTIASLYGLRAACVCSIIADRVRDEFRPGAGVEDAVRVANEAARIIGLADRAKKTRRRYPLASIRELAGALGEG